MADIELSTATQETTIDPAGDKFPFIDISPTPDVTKYAAVNNMIEAFFKQGSDVASAGTISFGQGTYFNITGTTTITDVDFSPDFNGRFAIAKFAGILTLTHHATTLILPTGANIISAAGDIAIFISEGSDNVRVMYFRASGASLSGGGIGGSTGGTDNAIIRADGTGGSAVQSSSATVNDSGDVVAGRFLEAAPGGGSDTRMRFTGTTAGLGAWFGGGALSLNTADTPRMLVNAAAYEFSTANSGHFAWYSGGTVGSGSLDAGITRGGGGIVKITDGSTGLGKLMIASHTPSSASDTGIQGQIAWDSNFIYICTATNTWKRVAIATW